MFFQLFQALLVIGVVCVSSNPIETPEAKNVTLLAEVLEDGRIMVEDMIMTLEQFNQLYPHVETRKENGATIHKRIGIDLKIDRLWPGGRIPYEWRSDLRGNRQVILDAMNEWMRAVPCIKFVPRTSSDRNYVVIQPNTINSCQAAMGCQGGAQKIMLATGCFTRLVMLHELGHTLGLYHEQQHPDRDRHINILWQNVDPKYKGWFKKIGGNWGVGYDIYSIMHYVSNAGVKANCNGCKTMTHKGGAKYDHFMGNAKGLSPYSDIPTVKKMYGCG